MGSDSLRESPLSAKLERWLLRRPFLFLVQFQQLLLVRGETQLAAPSKNPPTEHRCSVAAKNERRRYRELLGDARQC